MYENRDSLMHNIYSHFRHESLLFPLKLQKRTLELKNRIIIMKLTSKPFWQSTLRLYHYPETLSLM